MTTNKIENPTQGDTIIFKKTAEDTDGELLEFEMFIDPAASGPPQHVHPKAEEQFEVLSGKMQALIRDKKHITLSREIHFQCLLELHTLMDYDGNLPAYVLVSDGKTPDNKGAYDIPLLKNSVIVADRFYNDFSLLNVSGTSGVWFVVRHKENLQYTSI